MTEHDLLTRPWVHTFTPADQDALDQLADDDTHRALLEQVAAGWSHHVNVGAFATVAMDLLVRTVEMAEHYLDRAEQDARRKMHEALDQAPGGIVVRRRLRWVVNYNPMERFDVTRIDPLDVLQRDQILLHTRRLSRDHAYYGQQYMWQAVAVADAVVIPT